MELAARGADGALVWVTGSPGVGKSTACALLKARHELAVDADWEGYNHWVDRASDRVVVDPPYPVPGGWLEHFAWRISRAEVDALVERVRDRTAFLFGSAENEVDVWDLFDHVVCIVAENATLEHRLTTRATNEFGRHPEELAAALDRNHFVERNYRRFGATIIDGRLPPSEVAAAIIAAAGKSAPEATAAIPDRRVGGTPARPYALPGLPPERAVARMPRSMSTTLTTTHPTAPSDKAWLHRLIVVPTALSKWATLACA